MSIVDLSILENYVGSDYDAQSEVINIFVEKTTQDIEALEQSLKNQSLELWQETNHSMKSSVAMLGARPVYELCAAAEQIQVFDSPLMSEKFIKIREGFANICTDLEAIGFDLDR